MMMMNTKEIYEKSDLFLTRLFVVAWMFITGMGASLLLMTGDDHLLGFAISCIVMMSATYLVYKFFRDMKR
jgi:hypothetical protein